MRLVALASGWSVIPAVAVASDALERFSQAHGVLMGWTDFNTSGPICHDNFNQAAAGVACRTMGLGSAYGFFTGQSRSEVPNNYVAAVARCAGSEANLNECKIEHPTCYRGEMVTVLCSNFSRAAAETASGVQVEIFSGILFAKSWQSAWGAVCDDGFDQRDATVACRHLGYQWAIFKTGVRAAVPHSFSMGNLDCTGQENDLGRCKFAKSPLCTRGEAVALQCWGRTKMVTGVRLDDRGFLMGNYGEEWFGVAKPRKSAISEAVANVSCRQLGMGSGRFLPVDKRLWFGLDFVKCTGFEGNTGECDYRVLSMNERWARPSCRGQTLPPSYLHETGVKVENGVAMLHIGENWADGGGWRALHVARWILVDQVAALVCKQLGFQRYDTWKLVDPDYKTVAMTCPSGAELVDQCTFQLTSGHEAMGLYCYDFGLPLRLEHNILMARVDGVWGPVGCNSFGEKDAVVACRTLGRTMRGYKNWVEDYRIPQKKFTMDNVDCKGDEASFLNCSSSMSSYNRQLVRLFCGGKRNDKVAMVV